MGGRIEALLFDLDDTLGDWATAVENAVALAGLAEDELARTRAVLREFVRIRREGLVVDRQHWRLFNEHLDWERVLEDRVLAATLQAAFRTATMPRPYPDAAVLADLGRDYRIGLLTNNPYGKTALAEYGLLGHFEAVVMMDDPFQKPHRREFDDGCRAMALSPASVAMVGDSVANDIEGALTAGLVPIWVDRFADDYPLDAAAHRIETLWELPDLLRSL